MSSDGGTTWKSVFDKQPVSSIGSIAVAPSDPNVDLRRIGRGQHPRQRRRRQRHLQVDRRRQNVDARLGSGGPDRHDGRAPEESRHRVRGRAGPCLRAQRRARRVPDHGRRQDLAAGAEEGRGHRRVRRRDRSDDTRPIVFAGFWQARRFPWDLQSGGPGSGLYVSRDGGDTWKQLTGNGLPDGIWGKVGVAVAPSDGQRVYALIEAEKGGLFRSDDGGETWELVNPSHALRQRAWYYSTLTVNPRNQRRRLVSAGADAPYDRRRQDDRVRERAAARRQPRSLDRPENPKRMIAANDGGVDISRNGGATWFAPPLPISQFYHVAADTRRPYRVAGAMQDLGTAQGPSDSLNGTHSPDRLARRRRRRSRPRAVGPLRSQHRLCRGVSRDHHALRRSHRRVAQRQRVARESVRAMAART